MIQHISRLPVVNGNGELREYPDQHVVVMSIGSAWPGVGRCDSCGRIVARGIGRWWEHWWPAVAKRERGL